MHFYYHIFSQVQEEFARRFGDQGSDDEADPEEKDPGFYKKPHSVSVPEGEMARIVCETRGTQPLGNVEKSRVNDHYRIIPIKGTPPNKRTPML